MDKPELVARILQAEGRGLAMIFCRTKRTAADVAEQLEQRGFASGAVHGDLGQGAREQALRAFRNGKVDVLVCTDVAARGIDVEGVTHVINYQSPEDEKTYLHRIGRTGRAGASGTAITLVDWDDIPRWQLINKALDLPFNDPAETYSTSPHLFERARASPRAPRASCRAPSAPGPGSARRRSRTSARPAAAAAAVAAPRPRPWSAAAGRGAGSRAPARRGSAAGRRPRRLSVGRHGPPLLPRPPGPLDDEAGSASAEPRRAAGRRRRRAGAAAASNGRGGAASPEDAPVARRTPRSRRRRRAAADRRPLPRPRPHRWSHPSPSPSPRPRVAV